MQAPQSSALSWVCFVLAALVALILLVVGVVRLGQTGEWFLFAAGAGAVVVVFVTLALAVMFHIARQEAFDRQQEMLIALQERLEKMGMTLEMISEQQLLSDKAKSVAFRDKDRDAIRRAIQEEISRQEWEAALALANDIEQTFGYRAEADRFREEIRQKQREVIRQKVAESMEMIERHIRAEQWADARRDAERASRLFPDDPQARNLPQEIERRRQAQKDRLLQSWRDSMARHDVDGGIEILKQLDLYLTPAEAESLQADARSVFKEKLNSLRDQFAAAVHNHRWNDAIGLGETIVTDFPNSRLAQEVSEKMQTLRQRAAEPEGSAV